MKTGIELGRIIAGETHAPIVYFLRHGDRVKIGTTSNLKGRVHGMSASMLDVVLVVPGSRAVESAFHERFAAQRIYDDREWFTVSGELAEFLDGNGSASRADGPARSMPVNGTERITGLHAAASYLGMSHAAFEKARQRTAIPGEIRRTGMPPAWASVDLDAWRQSRPRAAT